MDDITLERVLRAVECIPAGRVVSYGDLAGLVGIGPRQVGSIMSTWGADVPWWRVTNASGDLPEHLLDRAAEHWDTEGVGLKPNRQGVLIRICRADLVALATCWEARTADLTDTTE